MGSDERTLDDIKQMRKDASRIAAITRALVKLKDKETDLLVELSKLKQKRGMS